MIKTDILTEMCYKDRMFLLTLKKMSEKSDGRSVIMYVLEESKKLGMSPFRIFPRTEYDIYKMMEEIKNYIKMRNSIGYRAS